MQPILQNKPIRVLRRRSPLEREKIIHWYERFHISSTMQVITFLQSNLFSDIRMRIERIAGSSQYFLLHLCTQVLQQIFYIYIIWKSSSVCSLTTEDRKVMTGFQTQAGTYLKEFVHCDLGLFFFFSLLLQPRVTNTEAKVHF